LLPALPNEWATGKIEGLRARGGFVVDMEWEDGKLKSTRVFSELGNPCRIAYENQVIDYEVEKAQFLLLNHSLEKL
jgi:alpha-L-fucosidase 2